jgi:hypothetical protein
MSDPKHDSLQNFSAYRDENGQGMTDEPTEVARPAVLQDKLARDPGGEAETARLASGHRDDDATAAVEAEVSAEAIDHISNPSLPSGKAAADEAVERATAALGKD